MMERLRSPRVRAAGTLAAVGLFCLAGYCWLDALSLSLSLTAAFLSGTALLLATALWFVVRANHSRGWLIFGLVVLSTAECLFLLAVRHQVSWRDRIGNPGDYDAWNGVCGRAQSVVRGPGDAVAVLRQVECTGASIVPPFREYFVFVHGPQDSADDPGTLALGYREWSDDPGWRFEPEIKWRDKSSLRIAMGAPSFVTRKRNDVQGVGITYEAGGVTVRDPYLWAPCANGAVWCDR